MRPIASILLCIVLAAGCATTPAPVRLAAQPAGLTLTAPPAGTDATMMLHAACAKAAAIGGTIYLSAGQYTFNGPLQIPPSVRLIGEGRGTRLTWTHDLGLGVNAISVDPRSTQGSDVVIESLTISGPGARGALGQAPAQMDGIQPGSFGTLRDVLITGGFRMGVVVRWDHVSLLNDRATNCLHSIWWGDGPGSKSNTLVLGGSYDGALLASFGIAGDNIIDSSAFINVHAGFSPYVWLKTDSGSTPSVVGMMQNTTVDGVSCEYVGNALISDQSTGGGPGQDTLNGVDFRRPGFSFDPTGKYRLSNVARDWTINARHIFNVRYFGGVFPVTAGDVGILNTQVGSDIDWDCGADAPVNFAGSGTTYCKNLCESVIHNGNRWYARPLIFNAAASKGQIVADNGSFYAVEPMTGQTFWGQVPGQAKPFRGIAMGDVPADGVQLVAYRGDVPALCEPVPVAGWPMYAVPGFARLSPVANGEPLAVSAGPGGAVGGGLNTVRIH